MFEHAYVRIYFLITIYLKTYFLVVPISSNRKKKLIFKPWAIGCLTRTTKDVFIKGVGIEESKEAVVEWFKENNVKILINMTEYVFGQSKRLFASAKCFEVTFEPVIGGVIAKTEGWIILIPSWYVGTIPELIFLKPNSAKPHGRSSHGGMTQLVGGRV